MSHGDSVPELPPGFHALAHSDSGITAAMADPTRKIYGLQFHPEVAHTPQGKNILRHFLFDVCGCRGDWTPHDFIKRTVKEFAKRVGESVQCASAGRRLDRRGDVDRASHRERLTCVFIDHGLLRERGRRYRSLRYDWTLRRKCARRIPCQTRGVIDPEKKDHWRRICATIR
jgi:GMP synthase (glutamine-hydrolysing)